MVLLQEASTDTQTARGPSSIPSLDIALDLVREQLFSQQAQGTALDTKAGLVLGSASFLTGSLFVFKPPLALASYSVVVQSIVHFLPYIVIVVYVLIVMSSFRAFTLRRYQRAANPARLYNHYLTLPEWQTKGAVLRTMVTVYQRNEKVLRAKVRWARFAFISLGLEVIVVLLMLVAQYLT